MSIERDPSRSPDSERRASASVPPPQEDDPPTLLAVPELPAGTVLAGCGVERLIGRGGMGQVYLAEHLTLRKKVALKILAAELFADPLLVDRFLREARLAAQLDHPNVVRILNAGQERGLHFIVLEFVDGESLERRLARDGRIEPAEALRIAEQMARGLATAHALGIIHRDIKPANVLLARDGGVKVADFGLAREVLSRTNLTASGQVLGTPSYMAPEQAESRPIDRRADLYALGATLFAALTGQPPFGGDSVAAVLYNVVHKAPRRPSECAPGIPSSVDRLVLRLLEKEPAQRYATADEVISAILAVGRGQAPPAPRGVPRRRLRVLAAAAATVALGVWAASWCLRDDDRREHTVAAGAAPHGVEERDPPPSAGGVDPVPGAETPSTVEIDEPVRWPKNWVDIWSEEHLDGRPLYTLGLGWVEEPGSWTAHGGAGDFSIPIISEKFVLSFEAAPVDEALAFQVAHADAASRSIGHRIVWKDGESIEWFKGDGESPLHSTPIPPRVGTSLAVQIGWFAEGILAVSGDGATLVHLQDPQATMPKEQRIRITPIGGGIRIRNLHLHIPLPQPHGPR